MKAINLPMLLAVMAVLLCHCSGDYHKADRDKFKNADQNKDGMLSLEEAIQFEHKRIFALVDYDRDDVISMQEARDIEPDFTQAKFNQYDLNRDGKVTFEEFDRVHRARGSVRRRFEATDADGNGLVTVEEADARLQFLQLQAEGKL